MKKAISAAVFAVLTSYALVGCSPAASNTPAASQATRAVAEAGPSSQAPEKTVAIEDFLVGRWHCTSDAGGAAPFFGSDSNLQRSIQEDVEFTSTGVMTQLDGSGKSASVSLTEKWEYKDGTLGLGKGLFVQIPEKVPVPGTTEVKLSYGQPERLPELDATTDVTFAPGSMTMKVAEYVDGHKATNQGQTVTCRK